MQWNGRVEARGVAESGMELESAIFVSATATVESRKWSLRNLRPSMLGLGNDWGCGAENGNVR